MSQVETPEKLSEVKEPSTSLLAICWLGIVAIAMVGWISALGWIVWRVANWALF